jgi:predicted ATPase
MITKIGISGFKSIVTTDPPIELGKVNVFIGANGSGKSNLLEAVGFLSSTASFHVTDAALSERGVRSSVPGLYESSFQDLKAFEKIEMQATGVDGGNEADLTIGFGPSKNATVTDWVIVNDELRMNFAGASSGVSDCGQALILE